MSRDFSIAPGGPRIAIDADGIWHVDGDPVVHPTVLAELVDRLIRLSDGRHVLRAGGGETPIEVAEAPFVVRSVELRRGAGGVIESIHGLLSDGSEERLDPASLRRVAGGGAGPDGIRVACTVKHGRFEARLSRFAVYQLLAEAEPTAEGRARLDTAAGPVVV